MRAGELNRKITIQRKTIGSSSSGFPTETWAAVAANYWAAYEPVSGNERSVAPQYVAKQQVMFRVRQSAAMGEPTPLDRVLFPAPADPDAQAPATTSIYDIIEVREADRRRGWEIVAVRRADVT